MMKQNNIILFDVPAVRDNLLPLSYTRPVADFLVGITTLRKKWEAFIDGVFSYFTPAYLSEKFPMVEAEENIFIACYCHTQHGGASARACTGGMPGGRHPERGACADCHEGAVGRFAACYRHMPGG